MRRGEDAYNCSIKERKIPPSVKKVTGEALMVLLKLKYIVISICTVSTFLLKLY